MLKRFMKLGAICLALVMVLSLAACGGNAQKPSDSTAATQASSASTVSEASTAPAAKEPITIKAAILMEGVEASTIKTDPVSTYIKDKFGITLDIVDNDAASSWEQKAPTVVAANDLPDLFMLVNQGANGVQGFLNTLIAADAVLPLDDLIANGAPEITGNVFMKAALDYQKAFISPDGKIYGFPTCVGISDDPKAPVWNNFIRWDAYKAAGYPKITNTDELLAALKKMQDVAPKDKNGKKAYGLSGWFAEGQGWGDWEILFGANSVVQNTQTIWQQKNSKQSLEQTNTLTDPNSSYWKTLDFFHKANMMGILDPDSFTTKWDDWNKKVEDGQVLWLNAGWIPGQKNPGIQANISPDAGFVPLPPLDSENFAAKVWNVGGERLYSIAKTSKYADRITELMNWVCSEEGSLTITNGPEGLAWKMVDGKPVANPDYLKLTLQDAQKQYGANIYHHFKGFYNGSFLPKYGTTADLRVSDEAMQTKLTSYEQDALNFYGAKSFGDANYFGKVKNNIYAYPLFGAIGNPTDEALSQYNNNIYNYYYKSEFKAILAKSDAEFNKIRDDMISFAKNNKADDILKWALTKETDVKAKLDPICKPIVDALAK